MLRPGSVQRTDPLGSPLGRGRRFVPRVGSLSLLSLSLSLRQVLAVSDEGGGPCKRLTVA